MRIKQLLGIMACMGLAFGLTSCKEEKKLVGTWEVEKVQYTETKKNHPVAEENGTSDTTLIYGAGDFLLTFTKKGVVVVQDTDDSGNKGNWTGSYMIVDKTLYMMGEEYAFSINGKEMTLTSEDTRKALYYKPGSYDNNGNWVPAEDIKYDKYSKTVITLKER